MDITPKTNSGDRRVTCAQPSFRTRIRQGNPVCYPTNEPSLTAAWSGSSAGHGPSMRTVKVCKILLDAICPPGRLAKNTGLVGVLSNGLDSMSLPLEPTVGRRCLVLGWSSPCYTGRDSSTSGSTITGSYRKACTAVLVNYRYPGTRAALSHPETDG